MKAIFVASHTQAKDLEEYYKRIYSFLEDKGYESSAGNLFGDEPRLLENEKEREKWYKESLKALQKADIVIVEISYPSTANVGHELTYALEIGKPVIALYEKSREPVFLRGRDDEKLLLFPYDSKDLEDVLNSALDYANTVQDVRFNFFISPAIGRYLDWIAKNRRVPRAVYLRRLIEQDMKENKEYNEE